MDPISAFEAGSGMSAFALNVAIRVGVAGALFAWAAASWLTAWQKWAEEDGSIGDLYWSVAIVMIFLLLIGLFLA